jgi:hypothetical protein
MAGSSLFLVVQTLQLIQSPSLFTGQQIPNSSVPSTWAIEHELRDDRGVRTDEGALSITNGSLGNFLGKVPRNSKTWCYVSQAYP